MMSFRGGRLAGLSLPLGTVWLLTDVAEARGRQDLYTKQAPQLLKALRGPLGGKEGSISKEGNNEGIISVSLKFPAPLPRIQFPATWWAATSSSRTTARRVVVSAKLHSQAIAFSPLSLPGERAADAGERGPGERQAP